MDEHTTPRSTDGDPPADTLTCPLCGQRFNTPGFDADQTASVLAAHLRASHTSGTGAAQAAAKAAAAGPTGGDERGGAHDGTAPTVPAPGQPDTTPSFATHEEPPAAETTHAPDTPRPVKPSAATTNAAGGPANTNHAARPAGGRQQERIPGAPINDGTPPAHTGNGSKAGTSEHGGTDTARRPRDARATRARDNMAKRLQTKPDGTQPGGKGGGTAEQAATKAAEAAASAAGVPPVVTRFAVKAAKKIVPYVVAAALVVGVVALGGGLQDAPEETVWDVSLSEQLDIPAPYLDAYQDAAREHKIPWTLLAAIGSRASAHGRVNPYLQNVPAPAPATNAPTDKYVVLGDSLTEGARPYLIPLLTQINNRFDIRSQNGARVAWGTEQFDDLEISTNPAAPTNIVVALGTNDSEGPARFAEDIDAFMNRVPSWRNTVWWLTVDKDGAGPYNQALREKARQWTNLRVVEWAAYAEDGGLETVDGIHYDAVGYQKRAQFIMQSVTGGMFDGILTLAGRLFGPGVLPAPVGECPTLATPIAGKTRNQGAGPLMLIPSVLDTFDADPGDGIQNICTSADTLASILADTAVEVAEETGYSFPRGIAVLARMAGNGDPEAARDVHEFWINVVDRSGATGTTNTLSCDLDEPASLQGADYVGWAIETHWRCALGNAALSSVDAISVDASGTVTYDLLPQASAVRRGVEEALSVAWTWSRWGQEPCDNAAAVAGVFPLTAAEFAAHDDGGNRCDWRANITAAANAYIAGERVPAALRGANWYASVGGWANFAHVAGPDDDASRRSFAESGPWEQLRPEQVCKQILFNNIVEKATDNPNAVGVNARIMQNHITDPDAATNNPWLVADLAAIADKTRGDPACATERAHALGDWYTVIADVYNGDTLTALGGGSGKPPLTAYDLDRPARTGDVAAALAATAFHENVRLTDTGVASTALLGRLSTTQLRVPGRPATAKLDTNGDLGAGAAAVNIAVGFYGGLFVGDDSGATGLGLVGPVIPYADIFNAVGQSAGVDPRLLAAVARQESNFNPDAGCPDSGPAYGMMQKEPDMEPTVCGDPQRQVEIAAQMLKDRHQEAGDWVGALWGYNNGGTFSRKWREISGDRDKAREFAVDFYCDDGDDSCTRANIAMSYVSDDPGVRSAYGTWLEYQTLFPTQVVSTTQLIVDATGCPRAARSGIPGRSVLRDGSADIGLYQLCADSVAAAASPEAARAIIWAFNNLGVPYSQTLRDTIAFDCSSYLSRAYESAGVPMSLDANGRRVSYSTHYLLPQTGWERPAWIVEIPAFDLKPGDLVFPSEGHVAMVLANGFMIHTNATGDVSKVERLYGSFLQANRVLANLAAVN